MMRRFYLLVFALLAAFGPLSFAQAQWSDGYRGTVSGEGRVKREGNTDFDIERVRVDLERGGSVSVVISGNRESLSLSGRWSNGNRDEPKVRFTRSDGRSATIEGTMEFSHQNGRLERITVSGREGRNDISLNFRAKDSGSGGSSGSDTFDQMNVRTSGTGGLNIGSDRWQITSVQVNLQRGGAARITLNFNGRRDETLEGRWSGSGEIIGVSFDRGLSGRLESARGTINRRKRTSGIDTINISGRANRQTVAVTFRAR